MKLPPYINEQDKILSLQIYKQIIKNEGYKQALITKKLMLAAAYGEMISGKLNYNEFIQKLKNHFISPQHTIDDFWQLKYEADNLKSSNYFLIPCEKIYYGTLHEIEIIIQNTYKKILNGEHINGRTIDIKYLKCARELFK